MHTQFHLQCYPTRLAQTKTNAVRALISVENKRRFLRQLTKIWEPKPGGDADSVGDYIRN